MILGLSREFIILKYPLAEPAIIYFFEIIEILNSIVLTITIFFSFYGILSVSKGFIVLKYPITEPYIQYFYEIIEIVKVTIFNLFY